MRETVKVKVNGKEYKFFAVPNIMEEHRINAEMANLLGGWENLTKMESSIDEFYRQHISYNEQKYGAEEFINKQNKLIELENGKEDEFMNLFMELNNNPYYLNYSKLLAAKMDLKYTAMAVILCVEGKENIENMSKEEMDGLLKEVQPLWNSFRKKDTKAKKDSGINKK